MLDFYKNNEINSKLNEIESMNGYPMFTLLYYVSYDHLFVHVWLCYCTGTIKGSLIIPNHESD